MSFAVTLQSASTRRVAGYVAAVVACCLTAAVAFPLRDHLDLPDIVMLFLLAVFLVATFFGRGPAVVASFLSVALFDYYFDTPHHFLFFGDAEHFLTFAIMLAVGLVTAQLVSRAAEKTDDARARERETRQLYEAARAMAGAHDVTQILEAAQHYLSNRGLGGNLLVAGDDDRLADHPGGHHVLSIAESGGAEAAYRGSEFVAADPRDHAGAAIVCFPLRAPTRVRGVLAVTPLDGHTRLADEQYKAVEALASLAALALERLHYAASAQRAELMVADERLRTSVLTSLSHDLRTPLTSLVGLADTLAERRETLPADAAETAGIIRDQAQAMYKLISDLLDMARLKSASAPLRREWQPFEDVVGSSLRLAENVAPDRHVMIDLLPDLPLIFFDAVLIERVLCNLLDNAFKYARPGARISLAARLSSAHLEVSVCNDGSEFPAGRIDSMFDLFVRGANESCIPGAGLGLAICKAIVEAHGGSIRAENRAGGACVRFTLPCLTPPPRHDRGRAMNTQSPLALVVEDEPQIRRFVCSALRDESCRASEAGSVAQGLDLAARERPDMVVLDLGLPDRDGVDFIRELRVWSAVPVLVLSARTDESDKIAALDAGADDYLTKPFGIGELRARVRAMLRRSQMQSDAGAGALHAFGDVEVDLVRRNIRRAGVEVHLTPLEYNLLVQLLINPGRVLTHHFLMDKIWGPANREKDHYLRVYVGRLRQKLEADPARPRHILTETGVGYRFQLQPTGR